MVDVIVFSKDRPWQLSEYLRTLREFSNGDYRVYVLYKTSNPEFDAAYADLVLKNKSSVEFVKEDDNLEFNDGLDLIINEFCESPHIMFGVDDVLFYDKFSFIAAEEALKYNYFYSYSLRLNPSITFCQPANSKNRVPTLSDHSKYDYFYNRLEGSGDWNYPWELSASIYKRSGVRDMIAAIRSKYNRDATSTPNHLEAFGSILASQNIPCKTTQNFAQKNAVCSTITINRVQEDYKNAVFGNKTAADLIEYYWMNKRFDTDKYRGNMYNSVHIGDLFLKE